MSTDAEQLAEHIVSGNNVELSPSTNEDAVSEPQEQVETETDYNDQEESKKNEEADNYEKEVDKTDDANNTDNNNDDNNNDDNNNDDNNDDNNDADNADNADNTYNNNNDDNKNDNKNDEPQTNGNNDDLAHLLADNSDKSENNKPETNGHTLKTEGVAHEPRASYLKGLEEKMKKDADDEDLEDKEAQNFQRRDTMLTRGENEYVMHVLKCCGAENGFDIYQLMAFDHGTKENARDWIMYIFNAIKSVSCALTQVIGICIIMYDFVDIGLQEKDWCNPPNYEDPWLQIFYDSNLKVLGFLFSSFLAYFSVDALLGVESGMYQGMENAINLKWVNLVWLRLGFSVNVFVSIIAVYGSFLVIFFSDNSLDMVLNSVALFFVVELDDLLVKQSDYERVDEHVKGAQHWHIDNKQDNEEKKCVNGRRYYNLCCNKFVACIGWIYTLPFQIIRYVTILACIIIPFWVGYCY